MFCSKEALRKLNNRHERSLRFIHQDYVSNIGTLLVNANFKLMHQKYLEFLMIEGYKYFNDLLPQIINHIFKTVSSIMSPTRFRVNPHSIVA